MVDEFVEMYDWYNVYKTKNGYEAYNTLCLYYILSSDTLEGIRKEIDYHVKENQTYHYAV